MSAKTLFAAVVLAGLSLGLGAGSPTHAAGDDELTLAREYWRLDALFGGHAVPEQDELETAARNLIKFCSETPVAQMPRAKLQTCETFHAWKAAHKREAVRKALEEARAELAVKRQKAEEKRRAAHRPGEVSLCPPPHKMTHDGCR